MDAIIESETFRHPDERVQRLRHQWELSRREVLELFEQRSREYYESRLAYHKQTLVPTSALFAANDLKLFQIGLSREREERLAAMWLESTFQVQKILQDQLEVRGA